MEVKKLPKSKPVKYLGPSSSSSSSIDIDNSQQHNKEMEDKNNEESRRYSTSKTSSIKDSFPRIRKKLASSVSHEPKYSIDPSKVIAGAVDIIRDEQVFSEPVFLNR